MEKDFFVTSRRERDVLKVMSLVLDGKRSQVEAGRLLDLSTGQVRRIQMRLKKKGDVGVVHGLRGKPSNRRLDQCGVAIIDERLDGMTHIRFKNKYSRFTKIETIPVGRPHPMPLEVRLR